MISSSDSKINKGNTVFIFLDLLPASIVEASVSSVAVEKDSNGASVGVDPSDVAACGERTELWAAFILFRQKRLLEGNKVNFSVIIETDFDYLSEALAPGEKVGVVLIGAEEDNPPFTGKKRVENSTAQGRRNGDANHLLQPLNGCSAAGTAVEEAVVWSGSCTALDVIGCLLYQLAHV